MLLLISSILHVLILMLIMHFRSILHLSILLAKCLSFCPDFILISSAAFVALKHAKKRLNSLINFLFLLIHNIGGSIFLTFL